MAPKYDKLIQKNKCYKKGVSIEGCIIVFASEFAASFVSGALFKKGFFGKVYGMNWVRQLLICQLALL